LGGPLLLGFIGAVAFATILAVVAGLTLSGAAALSHDLWTHVFRRGTTDPAEELRVARIATLFLGGLAVGLGIAFKGQNVAFMVGLAFAIAASGNFPALLLAMFWPRCTTGGAVAAMITGTGGTLLLIGLSPTVQVDILHHADALFPLRNPAIITLPLAFTAAVATSLLSRNPTEVAAFAKMERKALLGD
jgi:cation/acetate symporter